METTSSFETHHKIHHKFDLDASHQRLNTAPKNYLPTHSAFPLFALARKLSRDILALATCGLTCFVPWHGSGLFYVMDIYICAHDTAVDIHFTIIQPHSIFVANNTYFIQAHIIEKNGVPVSY